MGTFSKGSAGCSLMQLLEHELLEECARRQTLLAAVRQPGALSLAEI
jgi:hypothetical protein